MTYIPEAMRRQVIEGAGQCCEYCLIHQDDSLYRHEVDHIIPEKHRGETSEDNLCLACLECNRHKGSDFGSFDPETGQITPLFNPRQQHGRTIFSWMAHTLSHYRIGGRACNCFCLEP